MGISKFKSAAQQYYSVSLESEIAGASPHRLIQLLLEGVVSKIAAARHCIDSSNIAGKGESISTAISIIDGLRASLDKERGGGLQKILTIYTIIWNVDYCWLI